jgi:hypothetical protein
MEEEAKKPRYEWKNICIGRNPDTGRPYFERRKVVVQDPNQPPEGSPSGLLTKGELEKKMAEGMEKSFEKFGHPTKGSQPASDFEPDE